jgi:hypothetical protein
VTRTIARFFATLILTWPLGSEQAAAGPAPTPFETAVNTARGGLRNPYTDFAKVAKEGHKIYLSHDCNGCHGGGGGGGMAAPLTNEVWVMAPMTTLCSESSRSARARSVRETHSKNRASCARVRRTSSALCRRSAKYSGPTTISGRSFPGLGSSIASVIQLRVERPSPGPPQQDSRRSPRELRSCFADYIIERQRGALVVKDVTA